MVKRVFPYLGLLCAVVSVYIFIVNVPIKHNYINTFNQYNSHSALITSHRFRNARPTIDYLDDVSLKNEAYDVLDPHNQIRMATYNIHSAINPDGIVDVETVIEEIRQMDVDVIGLQEVDKFIYRSGFGNQAKVIADGLGMNYVYGETINILGIKYGNALLTKHEIIDWNNFKIPGFGELRGLLRCKISINGVHYNVFVTHLGLSYGERVKQIQALNEYMSIYDTRVVLMGDFNAQGFYPEMELLDTRMKDTAVIFDNEHINTFPFRNGQGGEADARTDYIFVTDDIRVVDYKVIPTLTSDHHKVMIVIHG